MSGRKKRRATRSSRGCSHETPPMGFCSEVYPQIRSWFGARVASEQDADGLAEEVLVRLARGPRPDNMEAYVATVAANALARYRRRRARGRDFLRRLLQDGGGTREMAGTELEDAPEQGEMTQERDAVEKLLTTLPIEQARLLRLRFLEGLSVTEAARQVGCSRQAAYKRLQRVLRRLGERREREPSG
jgi:RNA polymerase sigma factor (sigma-70 family)